MAELKPLIAKVAAGTPLTRAEAREAFGVMMSGDATPAQIGGFLMALRVRGETVDEITGAVEIMRERMLPVEAPSDAIDIVGTGGDASGSYNISTCAAFVAAGAGLKVAKHGNRALSSRSGAADVLMALGVRIDVPPEKISECVAEAGLGFMFAPAHHSSMKFVGPSRVELGTRTIFNLLGPLSNPARAKRQVTGVFSRQWVEPLAQVLRNLGCEACWICHGEGGMDEIVPTGTTWISELRDGRIASFTLTPEEAGLKRSSFGQLKGGDALHNADALRHVLAGKPSAFRDAAVMTAAAALVVASREPGLKQAVAAAQKAIDSGAAEAALARLIKVSNG
ncbi:anthranilate phosphoribosyltransferase [Aestuariivirga sp.]|uniref:anthranilate phosphoribosyltransferase n=1 Tax=Aestuariivirga sp. TaxID=2650926 RepID=UPI0025BA987B|nr:anthranilate phosphoribosyltransferase [Aestuariivirga sp.]MCA3556148.1 anthranilate phosphoribosyltransferase [Aestuariivirga sp.]